MNSQQDLVGRRRRNFAVDRLQRRAGLDQRKGERTLSHARLRCRQRAMAATGSTIAALPAGAPGQF
jgi:hypothetical protein